MNTRWREICIHGYDSLVKIDLHQFAGVRTIDEYDVTITVPRIRATSWVKCGDVTVSQKRPFFGDEGELNDRCLFLACLCVQGNKSHVRNEIMYGLPRMKYFFALMKWFGNDFYSWLGHLRRSSLNHLYRNKKLLFMVTHTLFYISSTLQATHITMGPEALLEVWGGFVHSSPM